MRNPRTAPLPTFSGAFRRDFGRSRFVFRILADPPKLDPEGRPIRVPYGLRKVEASLVRAYGRDAVVIADPRNIDRYIDDETEVVGLSPMDPLGLGPVSMSFTMGGVLTPFTKAMFLDLVRRVQRPNRKYKVVLGGPGAWHFDYRPEMQASLDIDDIFLYNLENWKTMEPNEDAVKDLFRYVMAQPGVSHCYPTHGTVSAAVTNPGLIRDISDIVRAGPRKWVGIQSGIETGSPALSRAVLHRKAAPFSAEEWPDLVVQGTRLPAPTRALIVATARIGGRYILGIMHRYARRMGFRIRAPATTRRQAEGHTVSFPAA